MKKHAYTLKPPHPHEVQPYSPNSSTNPFKFKRHSSQFTPDENIMQMKSIQISQGSHAEDLNNS